MRKGFTIVELLIVLAIAMIVFAIAVPIVFTGSENSDSYCEWFKFTPAHQVPIGCYKHFNVQLNQVPYVIPR